MQATLLAVVVLLLKGMTTGVAMLAFLCAALISPVAHIGIQPAPVSTDTRQVQGLWVQARRAIARPAAPQEILTTRFQLDAASRLASHAWPQLNMRAGFNRDELTGALSLRIARRSWLNVGLQAQAGEPGFPPTSAQIGAIQLPPVLMRAGLKLALALVDQTGAGVDPDQLVRQLQISGGGLVRLTIELPDSLMASVRQNASTVSGAPDMATVSPYLASLLDLQMESRFAPVPLDTAVRRVFTLASVRGGQPVMEGRAALIALAMQSIDYRVGRISGKDSKANACEPESLKMLVAGREDLAKHFALSAVLSIVGATRFSEAAGEYKELNDSLRGGSGFSFVDLLANRAGLRIEQALRNRAQAPQLIRTLAVIDAAGLLPTEQAGRLDEGLSAEQFREKYGSLTSEAYTRQVALLDSLLDQLALYQATAGRAGEWEAAAD